MTSSPHKDQYHGILSIKKFYINHLLFIVFVNGGRSFLLSSSTSKLKHIFQLYRRPAIKKYIKRFRSRRLYTVNEPIKVAQYLSSFYDSNLLYFSQLFHINYRREIERRLWLTTKNDRFACNLAIIIILIIEYCKYYGSNYESNQSASLLSVTWFLLFFITKWRLMGILYAKISIWAF